MLTVATRHDWCQCQDLDFQSAVFDEAEFYCCQTQSLLLFPLVSLVVLGRRYELTVVVCDVAFFPLYELVCSRYWLPQPCDTCDACVEALELVGFFDVPAFGTFCYCGFGVVLDLSL